MAKVYIALVGGQPTPVYLGIIGTRPNRVELIVSPESRNQVTIIRQLLPPPLPISTHELSPIDPVETHRLANSLAEQYAEDEVYVNVSSGTKSWSHIFGYVFQAMPNAHVIYVDQNNNIWDYKTDSVLLVAPFNLKDRFVLNNNPLNHYTAFSDYTDEDRNVLRVIREARAFDVAIFEQLTNPQKKSDANKLTKSFGSFDAELGTSLVEWGQAKANNPGFFRLTITKKSGLSKEFVAESRFAARMLFHTGWFEFEVADMLSHWGHAQEICMNVVFPAHNNAPKNEVDVIVSTGVKVLFVECKLQIVSPTDINKFSNVVKLYGGTGAKGIFITDQPISNMCVQKCEENNLLHFSLHDKGRDAANRLYAYLDKNIATINA